MDEKLEQLIANVNQPVPPEPIPSDALFYRQVFLRMINQKKHVPSPGCFAYTPQSADDGLSVDWAARTMAELSLAIVGRTFKYGSADLKDPKDYALYKIDGTFLASLEDAPVSRHDPVFRGNPPCRGEPNNPAHAVLRYTNPNDEEIRVKLQNHVERVAVDQEVIAAVNLQLIAQEQ